MNSFYDWLVQKWHQHFWSQTKKDHHYVLTLKGIIKEFEQRSLGRDPLLEKAIVLFQKEVDRLEKQYEGAAVLMVEEVKIPHDFGIEMVLRRMIFEMSAETRLNGRDFCIYMPQYCIDYLRREIVNKYHVDSRQINEYEGMKIHAGYEDKIVIVHRDYPVYKKNWMIQIFNIAQKNGEQ